jgi:hypothetical protein
MTDILSKARRANRIWLYKPQWYWHGWKTLIPLMIGHDEYARRTIMLGWTVTGRVVVPLGDCGDPECRRDAIGAIVLEAAESLGIKLLPWQVEFAQRFLNGERFMWYAGRRGGRSALQQVIAKVVEDS